MAKKICVSETGGKYLGVFDGSDPQEAFITVDTMPGHGFDVWDYNNKNWIHYVEPYDIKRRQEYPPEGDQLDQIWKWIKTKGLISDTSPDRDLNKPEGMAGEIEEVKKRNSKPLN